MKRKGQGGEFCLGSYLKTRPLVIELREIFLMSPKFPSTGKKNPCSWIIAHDIKSSLHKLEQASTPSQRFSRNSLHSFIQGIRNSGDLIELYFLCNSDYNAQHELYCIIRVRG